MVKLLLPEFETKKALPLVSIVLLILAVATFTPSVSSAPTVPSANNYPFTYDPSFNTLNSNCWIVGANGRASQNLPDGYWYPNTAFDSSWFGQNYAYISSYGYASLFAYSTYDLLWGGRGWSNSFVHQGRPVYAGGVYEGHFKAGSTSGTAIPVDGIIYNMGTQEPTNKEYFYITARVTQDDLNCWQSCNGLLISFLFQYVMPDGSLSFYDSPAATNNMQSLHFDLFIHRDFKFANIRFVYPSNSWSYTLGDKYNADIHMQYVYNGEMTLGQNYTFVIDFGAIMNQLKSHLAIVIGTNNLPQPQSIILRYTQVSAETIGGILAAQVYDYGFYVT